MTILGLVAHQLLREAALRADFPLPELRWDEVVEEINDELRKSWVESSLDPLQSTAPMYQVLKKRTCARASDIRSTKSSQSAATTKTGRRPTGYEVWVESRDQAVAGSIDRVERIDGAIVLSDLKTGGLVEAVQQNKKSSVKKSYEVQLKLYAALYEQTFGVWPSRLRVVPLSGPALDLNFTPEECARLLADAAGMLQSLNDKIRVSLRPIPDLAFPSPAVCRFCTFRPVCKAYRQQSSKAPQAWPADVFGVIWDINALRDGKVNLRIATDSGEQVILRALTSNLHPALKDIQRGHQVGMFNARATAGRREFGEGPLTVLYRYENSFFTPEQS